MSEIREKMLEAVDAEMNKTPEPSEVEVEEIEPTEKELEAKEFGWNPDGQDRDGNKLSADEFLARKPLFNKIRNQSEELSEIKTLLHELKSDNRKITEEGIKEKESLLSQLKEAKESHLDNLDVDKVREIDKQIDSVREEIASKSQPEEQAESPYFKDFVKDNDWASNDNSPLSIASEGIARRYIQTNPNASDKEMYQHIHDQVRKDFPEKFQEKPRSSKVASAKSRATTEYGKKQALTLSDLSPEDQKVVSVMAERTGKTTDEYLKNDTLDDWR